MNRNLNIPTYLQFFFCFFTEELCSVKDTKYDWAVYFVIEKYGSVEETGNAMGP